MLPPRPDKVDIALLHEDYEPFAYAPLVQYFGLLFGEDMDVGLGQHQDGVGGIIKIGPVFVIISQNPTALGPEGFITALASPFTAKNCPEAEARVRSHRKNIFITVGNSDILTAGVRDSDVAKRVQEALGEDVFSVKTPPKGVFSDWLFVARMVCNHIAKMTKPTLIHWCQSDQLLLPDQMDTLADPRGMRLHIHPSLFSSGNDRTGKQMLGYHAFGSEHLTGFHVIVEETALPFDEVRSAVDNFIYGLSSSDTPPMDGQTIRMKSGAALKVHLRGPSESHPRQHISVDVLAVGDALAQETQGAKERQDALNKVLEKPAQQTTQGPKPFVQTLKGKALIAVGLIILLGVVKGAIALGLWYLWNTLQKGKAASPA